MLRPVDGSERDAVGIFAPLEPGAITDATHLPPDPDKTGDVLGGLLLRDAVRLTLRSGAGPFRSLGKVSVVPSPYQYVPLIMALRLDPVRLMIADDVGVGKTIEAGMIARELLDRGVVRRIGVLCPPHLCEQWSQELSDKFGIETAVIQPSKMSRLERGIPRRDQTVFEFYPHLVASIDYVKSNRYRHTFVQHAPDLIIVDEAHTASRPRGHDQGAQQQRHRLLRELADDPNRHIILTTATPHSGIEEGFRSLIGLLNKDFDLPIEATFSRRNLLPHLVQRRRLDLVNWLGTTTPFPERNNLERTYLMSQEYTSLYESILDFCRQTVTDADGRRQRVRYWAAIAILRCVLSSPAAAEATLRKRADRRRGELDDEPVKESDFTAQILDSSTDLDNPPDYAPTSPLDDPDTSLTRQELRRLEGFLATARKLRGIDLDAKLSETINAVGDLLADGYRPIVYCRFIDSASYGAEHMQKEIQPKHPNLQVRAVTGGDGNDEQRREIVASLTEHSQRVLVATDCLSEGINLQEHFDAVIHYDLPWNPNRLEQREGRVDRYGQPSPTVKTVLIWGQNNAIDQALLRVLIRKAREIRGRLGISVAAPIESDAVIQAVIQDIFMQTGGYQLTLGSIESQPTVSEYHTALDETAEREDRNRAYYSQGSIQPDEVDRELKEMEPALGSAADVKTFLRDGLQRFGGELRASNSAGVFELRPGDLRASMIDRGVVFGPSLRVCFDGKPRPRVVELGRNHPVVTTLSDHILNSALSGNDTHFARCGAAVTGAVSHRTVVLLLRIRYLLTEGIHEQFAEEVVAAAFRTQQNEIHWLKPLQESALDLLSPSTERHNPDPGEAPYQVNVALDMLTGDEWAQPIIAERVAALAESHQRLRGVVGGFELTITPHPRPDILGCYVLIPSGGG